MGNNLSHCFVQAPLPVEAVAHNKRIVRRLNTRALISPRAVSLTDGAGFTHPLIYRVRLQWAVSLAGSKHSNGTGVIRSRARNFS